MHQSSVLFHSLQRLRVICLFVSCLIYLLKNPQCSNLFTVCLYFHAPIWPCNAKHLPMQSYSLVSILMSTLFASLCLVLVARLLGLVGRLGLVHGVFCVKAGLVGLDGFLAVRGQGGHPLALALLLALQRCLLELVDLEFRVGLYC